VWFDLAGVRWLKLAERVWREPWLALARG